MQESNAWQTLRRENESKGIGKEDVQQVQDYSTQGNGESHLREQKTQAKARMRNIEVN